MLASRSKATVAAGATVTLRGWLAHPGGPRIRELAVVCGDQRALIDYGLKRNDLAVALGRDFLHCGFEGPCRLPDGAVDEVKLTLEGRLEDGSVVKAADDVSVQVALAVSGENGGPRVRNAAAIGRFRVVEDTFPADPLHGRSRRSVRSGAALEVRGWALLPGIETESIDTRILLSGDRIRRAYIPRNIFDGEASVVAGRHVLAGFHAFLDLDELDRGLYFLTAVVRGPDGTWIAGPTTPFEVSVPYEPAPKFLPELHQRAIGIVERTIPENIERSDPIAISGWAIDPATKDPGRGVFACLDNHHPLPVPSFLPYSDAPTSPAYECTDVGFAGIVDTSILLPGTHRIRIALLNRAGTGWHVLLDRRFIVNR